MRIEPRHARLVVRRRARLFAGAFGEDQDRAALRQHALARRAAILRSALAPPPRSIAMAPALPQVPAIEGNAQQLALQHDARDRPAPDRAPACPTCSYAWRRPAPPPRRQRPAHFERRCRRRRFRPQNVARAQLPRHPHRGAARQHQHRQEERCDQHGGDEREPQTGTAPSAATRSCGALAVMPWSSWS